MMNLHIVDTMFKIIETNTYDMSSLFSVLIEGILIKHDTSAILSSLDLDQSLIKLHTHVCILSKQ